MGLYTLQLAAGSVLGREHRLGARNCQDAYYLNPVDTSYRLGIVADGCGSSLHSEVGAWLGVRLLGDAIDRELGEPRATGQRTVRWERVQQHVLASLDVLLRQMHGDYRQLVEEFLYFTLVGVLIVDDMVTFFALGDGVIIVNGQLHQLGPFPGNMPPYLGYGLLGDELAIGPEQIRLAPIMELPLAALDTFLIGTDGVMDLIAAPDRSQPGSDTPVGTVDRFWTDERCFANPDMISRQLRLIARDWPKAQPQPGLLPDDTTIIVGRRVLTEETERGDTPCTST